WLGLQPSKLLTRVQIPVPALRPHGRRNPSFLGPSFRIASSSSIAATKSRTSSPAFSRSFAMARTFGIVFSVSHSRVSFLSLVGAACEGLRRVIDPSRLTNVSYVSRRDYLAAPAPTA